LKHVAICHDVVLEQTIALREALRDCSHHAHDTLELNAWLVRLDALLPMRPIESEAPAMRVAWASFVKADGS